VVGCRKNISTFESDSFGIDPLFDNPFGVSSVKSIFSGKAPHDDAWL
jgi:hypothetical protein